MKAIFFSIPAIVLAAVLCFSQSVPPSQTAPAVSPAAATVGESRLPTGTAIPVELSKSLDAKKAKPGEKIEARTAMDLLSHGQVVIPRNSKITGHVTEAKAHTKDSPGSHVTLTFDHVFLKNGQEFAMQSSVQAVGRPMQASFVPSPDTMGPNGMPSAGNPPSMGGNAGGSMGGAPTGSMGGGGRPTSGYPSSYPSGNNPEPPPDANTSRATPGPPLDATSQGVVGIKGLTLNNSGPNATLSSDTANVHLDSGTQLILKTQ